MIAAKAATDPGALAARLADRAAALVLAQREAAELTRRSDPARWRKASLLWPLFTKG